MVDRCRKRPKRKIPRRFNERDVARILRIICEQKGVRAARRAIGRARIEGRWHEECEYLEGLCEDEVLESLDRMITYAGIVESIVDLAQEIVESPLIARIIRSIPRAGPVLWAALVAAANLSDAVIEGDIENVQEKLIPALNDICEGADDDLPLPDDRRRPRPRPRR